MNSTITRLIFLLSVLLTIHEAHAQQIPLLERRITIRFVSESPEEALKKISKQAGFTFSYASSVIKPETPVTGTFNNQSVRQILDQLFEGTLQYKERGKYIILTRASTSSRKNDIITGYVVDEATGERLKDVAIYDPISLKSTLSDDFGYFELKVDRPPSDLKLVVNKINYSDTLVVAPSGNGRLFNIKMKTTASKITTIADTVSQRVKRFWNTQILLKKEMKTMMTVKDTFHRKSQVSFVPFIGTNHALSGNVVNDLSFNVIGGYSLGVQNAEVGGVFNVVEKDVKVFQLAGVFNAVGGSVEGFQGAGVFNATRGKVKGGQIAGVFNFHWDEISYFSGAGVFNFNRKGSNAVQLAGTGNFTLGNQTLPHFAGVINFTVGDAQSQLAGVLNVSENLKGFQGAGVTNLAFGNVDGAQLAGVLNVSTKDVEGSQVAGVGNFAFGTIKGSQVSGIVNVAGKVNGVQLGLINMADSVGGVPIGLISFVNRGYHKLEFSADEIFHLNASFRAGVNKFYNILSAGVKTSTLSDTATHWTFGYGVGTAPKISRTIALNFDLTANQIMQGNKFIDLNMINKFSVGVDIQLAKKFSLAVAGTLNAHLTKTTEDRYWDLFDTYQPQILADTQMGDDVNLKMWIGGKVALRFF